MRPITDVILDKEVFLAVLDTGARRSYIRRDIAEKLEFLKVPIESFEVRIGGQEMVISERYLVQGFVKDSENQYRLAEMLFPIDDLGSEDDKRIDILFGAIILEDWGTKIDESTVPPKIDFSLLRKGELVELYAS